MTGSTSLSDTCHTHGVSMLSVDGVRWGASVLVSIVCVCVGVHVYGEGFGARVVRVCMFSVPGGYLMCACVCVSCMCACVFMCTERELGVCVCLLAQLYRRHP